jgi:peptide/nickel transport system substrate-binding protein
MTPSLRRTLLLGFVLLVGIAGGLVLTGRLSLSSLDRLNAPRVAHEQPQSQAPRSGGLIVATVRAEPRSFNRFIFGDTTAAAIETLTLARLVRINPLTREVEPWLAERWDTTDQRRYVLHLRGGVQFSDGMPFTAADVVFTFKALYDPKVDSILANALKFDGKEIAVETIDDHTVALTFPSLYGPGLRVLDNLPILPRHRLEAALNAGTFRDAWGVTTPPPEIVGLGPFKIHAYRPGERLEFERNEHYWRVDEHGTRLPYADRVTLDIVPNQSAETLRLESGQADVVSGELQPDEVPAFRKMQGQGRVRLFELGPGLDADFLWFNLKSDGPAARAANGAAAARPWLARRELRQAISYAVDRQQFVNTVFLGAGTPINGPVTPANKAWFAPELPSVPHDLDKARALLAEIGLTDRNHDGMLEASDGSPAKFTLFTQKGRPLRERAAAFLKEDLRKIGFDVEVTALEFPALVDRVMHGAYDAVYFGFAASDTDPAVNLDFWLSSGAFHVWNPGQDSPATPWEKQIDTLMHQQMQTTNQAERKRLFAEVQRVFATEIPVLCFAAPNVIIATSSRLVNAHPALFQPMVLWSADTLAVQPDATR